MKRYEYLDETGTFQLENPELTSYLYFPIANEAGVMSSITPALGGDLKLGQHNFLLQPVSSEELHNNKSTRNFWIHIKGAGAWSATGVSARQQGQLFTEEKEETELTAGIMWHQVKRRNKKMGISATITSFVPYSGETLELMEVVIQNEGAAEITFTPTAAIPLYGRSADNIRDHKHVTSLLHRIRTEKNGVILCPTLAFDERGHQKNHMIYGVFGKDETFKNPVGFFPVVEDYIGNGGSFEHPEAVISSRVPVVRSGESIEGYEALGGLRFEEITLKPGEKNTYTLVLGFDNQELALINTAERFLDAAVFKHSLKETKDYWQQKINISYHSASKDFDNWMNWVNFQPMLRRIYGCSFLPHHDYGKGGRGWRDLWQDCLALLVMNPDGVGEMIRNNFAGVRIDGSNATIIGTKPGEFIADRNNITRVWMDHGVWPLMTAKLYMEQSGDIGLLLEEVSYFKDRQSHRGEAKDEAWSQEQGNRLLTTSGEIYQGTILEHLLIQQLTAFYDVGEHNHMRLRGADWNDALDMAGARGESVAFTAAYAGNFTDLAQLIEILSEETGMTAVFLAREMEVLLADEQELYDSVSRKKELLATYYDSCHHRLSGEKAAVSCQELIHNLKNKASWIKEHIRNTEWVSDEAGYAWFNGYYDNNGRRVEGQHPLGSRMMLTSQVFTIMSGTASTEQMEQIIKAADRYLYCDKGGYRLNSDFKEMKTDLGRMFGFAYGHKENGAVFSHMSVMYANALYQKGFAREAYKVINSLYSHLSNFEQSKVYPGVPEYINAKGQGLYHYLTGSASWLLLTVLTEMYGVKGKYGDLFFEPKLLREQFDEEGKAAVDFVFQNKQLRIEYYNPEKKEYGSYFVKSILIDDELYENNTNKISKDRIRLLEDKQKHHIKVIL